MEDEEQGKQKVSGFTIGMDLSDLSVEELHETAVLLKEEIKRIEATAKTKSDHLSAADALFKS